MQAFKTLLIVAVLSAVAYGVYVGLTGARDVEPPPGVVAEEWQGGPQIELPTTDGVQGGSAREPHGRAAFRSHARGSASRAAAAGDRRRSARRSQPRPPRLTQAQRHRS